MITIRRPTIADAPAFVRLQENYPDASRVGGAKTQEELETAVREALLSKGLNYYHCADLDGSVVGALGCYPTTSKLVQDCLGGEIADDLIVPVATGDVFFVSGVNILEGYRFHRDVLGGLLANAAYEIASKTPRLIYSQSATPLGQALIDRFGFSLVPNQAESIVDPFYFRRAVDRNEVNRLVGRHLRTGLVAVGV